MIFGQAAAAWQWFNYAAAQAPTGSTILRINLDETSVKLFQGDGKGAVFFKKKRGRPGLGAAEEGEAVQAVSLKKKRACLTHIGLICDRAEVQPALPQVLIGNEATFLAGEFADLQAACPANVFLVRQRSAWSNVETCMRVLRLLAAALRRHEAAAVHPPLKRLQPVLLMDACRLHIHSSVARSCAALGIWLVVVPARLTWLLQPLDTRAFQIYKEHFRAAYQRARLETADGQLAVADFLAAFFDTIRRVLQGRRWASAFEGDGFGPRQAKVSAYILRELQYDEPPAVPSEAPTSEMLQLWFPRRSAVPEAILMQPYRRQLALQAPGIGAAPALGAAAPLIARGSRLAPKRLALAPPPQARPFTRLQAALRRGADAQPIARPGKERRD